MADPSVQIIGDYIYRTTDDLGKGSYGEVYKCRHQVSLITVYFFHQVKYNFDIFVFVVLLLEK